MWIFKNQIASIHDHAVRHSFTVSVSETTNNISVYGPHIFKKTMHLSRGEPSQIHCETYFDTPQANVTWYTIDVDKRTRIFSSNDALFYSNKARISTITLVPTDDYHRTAIYCCMDIAWKYRICSAQYNIIIRGNPIY